MDIHHAAVIGAGLSGRAVTKLLSSDGISVRLLERHPDRIPQDFLAWAKDNRIEIITGEHESNHFTDIDLVVPSPAAPLASILPLLPADNAPAVMAETEVAWRGLTSEKVVSVTGTSGKTTTTSLVSAMLTAQGFRVFTGGNIGVPLSEYVLAKKFGTDKADIVVLELSSFQLQTCHDFRPDIGLILNISENHLDFHKDMNEYIAAKMNMFAKQTHDDVAIFADALLPLAKRYHVQGRVLRFDPAISRFTDMRLLGPHNRANAEAAFVAAGQLGVKEDVAKRAVATFTPLEHRLEIVAERNGILYINDSKSTTVEALNVALNAFDKPILLLAGGKFKGGNLSKLIPLVKAKVRHVALYGAGREHFEAAWDDVVPISYDETLEQATRRLSGSVARSGDVILLSPATASFDQYTSYIARGEDFRRIVGEVTA